MKVIKPTAFDATTQLVSTTATDPTPAWSSATTYALAARVVFLHTIYESLVASNVNKNPAASPDAWLAIGPDNPNAMFDGQVSTATTATNSLSVTMRTRLANSLALLGLVGSSVTVTVRDGLGGPVVYNKTFSLDGSFVYDYYMYVYEPNVQIGELVLTDLPPYTSAHTTIAMTGAGAVEIGQAASGTFYDLGSAEYGATAGITDYSRKETDEFGNTTFVQRAYSKRMSARLMLNNGQMNKVQRVLSDLRATPAVWIGADSPEYLPLVVFGFYRDFNIEVSYPTYSYCSLDIEGLI